jgi:outer membrane protein OmpA-like peptidoglycan-associated protein
MKKFIRQSASSNHQDSEHWMSVSDLMSGLMMVFLFISIAMMRSAFIERDKIKEVAVAYQEKQVAIYEQLMLEFKDDLVRWDADIDKQSLAFRFNSPDILFATGEATLTPTFQSILQEFFPRFLKALNQFQNDIEEIKIEGHTSSQWEGATKDIAYFKNMDLSQARTNSVLKYVYSIEKNKSTREWIRNNIAAVGYSSSRLVFTDKGNEDSKRSRRVTFRVLTNAETQIRKILGD